MNDELTNLTNIPAPTLTLDPVVEDTAVKASIIEVEAPPAPSLADSLSAEELAQVDAFAQQIDIANSQQVLTFGSGAQKKMADFSETALERVRTQDLGEAGGLLARAGAAPGAPPPGLRACRQAPHSRNTPPTSPRGP